MRFDDHLSYIDLFGHVAGILGIVVNFLLS